MNVDLYNKNQDRFEITISPIDGYFVVHDTKDNIYENLISQYEIIFNPKYGFCEAVWGECSINNNSELRFVTHEDCRSCSQIAWKYHKQQMSISPDPIKYLEDNCG